MCAGPGLSLKGAPGRSQWHEKHTQAGTQAATGSPAASLAVAGAAFVLEITDGSFIIHSTEEKTRFGPKAAARPVRAGAASGHRDSTAIMITPGP